MTPSQKIPSDSNSISDNKNFSHLLGLISKSLASDKYSDFKNQSSDFKLWDTNLSDEIKAKLTDQKLTLKDLNFFCKSEEIAQDQIAGNQNQGQVTRKSSGSENNENTTISAGNIDENLGPSNIMRLI